MNKIWFIALLMVLIFTGNIIYKNIPTTININFKEKLMVEKIIQPEQNLFDCTFDTSNSICIGDHSMTLTVDFDDE